MRDTQLQEWARVRADELPGAGLEHPFGPEADVYKVRGKVFMLLSSGPGRPVVNLKARPGDSEALRAAFAQITPGWHMNKRHWISVHPGEQIDEALLGDLVTESYLLVVEGLPRAARPVDPATFGRPQRSGGAGA